MALLSLVAKLGLDSTGFQQGIGKAESRVESFASNIKGQLAAAFSGAAAIAYLRHLNQMVGRIKDLSEQFNVSTDEVQKVDFAMKQSGMTFEDYAKFINRVSDARRRAVVEDGDARKAFESLGISVDDANDPLISNAQIMGRIATAIRGANITAAEQVRLADLLGEKFATVANVLAGLEDQQLPTIISKQNINQLDEANKQLEKMKDNLNAMVVQGTSPLVDAFNKAFSAINNYGIPRLKKALGMDIDINAANKAAQIDFARLYAPGIFDAGKGAGNVVAKAAQGILEQLGLGAGKPDRQKMFGEPATGQKQEQAKVFMAPRMSLQSSDQLGRIGAFSGGASNSVLEQTKKTTDALIEIKRVLEVKGIVVKDL